VLLECRFHARAPGGVTAHDDSARREKAFQAGAANFFRKPFDAKAFLAAGQRVHRNAI